MTIAPVGLSSYVAGAGDDPTEGIGAGAVFQSATSDVGPTDHVVTWTFNDLTMLNGVGVACAGAVIGDTFDYSITAPATQATSSIGTGNANQTGNIFVPAPSDDGNLTIDLSEAVPVPNQEGTGFWDWIPSPTGPGTITMKPDGNGSYDLYAVDVLIAHVLAFLPLVGETVFWFPLEESKRPPQWNHVATIHNSGHASLSVTWNLTLSRSKVN